MKIWICICLLTLSCSRKSFVDHKVQLDLQEGSCTSMKNYFKMISNFGGDRYEFEKCLTENYAMRDVSSERRGDTVVVFFRNSKSITPKLYKVTLDIDSYPSYKYLQVDDDVFTIISAEN